MPAKLRISVGKKCGICSFIFNVWNMVCVHNLHSFTYPIYFHTLSVAHLTIHPLCGAAPWSYPTRPSWRWRQQRPQRETNKTRTPSRLAPSQPTPPSASRPRLRRSRSQRSLQPKVRMLLLCMLCAHTVCVCVCVHACGFVNAAN